MGGGGGGQIQEFVSPDAYEVCFLGGYGGMPPPPSFWKMFEFSLRLHLAQTSK